MVPTDASSIPCERCEKRWSLNPEALLRPRSWAYRRLLVRSKAAPSVSASFTSSSQRRDPLDFLLSCLQASRVREKCGVRRLSERERKRSLKLCSCCSSSLLRLSSHPSSLSLSFCCTHTTNKNNIFLSLPLRTLPLPWLVILSSSAPATSTRKTPHLDPQSSLSFPERHH